jgi:hypothetical protein
MRKDCPSHRHPRCLLVAASVGILLSSGATGEPALSSSYDQTIPPAVRGPFISHPGIMSELDCPSGQCGGSLDFSRLIQARARTSPVKGRQFAGNPFKLKIAALIPKYIGQDLSQFCCLRVPVH